MKRIFLLSIGFLLAFTASIQGVFAQSAQDATLEYSSNVTQANTGDEFEVQILLKNPSQQPIISVRSWLQYDPQVLEGVSIDTEGTPFTLAAPGEDEFSVSDGLVKVGRSNISGGFSGAETRIATIRFKVIGTSGVNALVEPYDFQTSELGHVSVNIIEEGFPVNVLSGEPQSLPLTINSGGSTPIQVDDHLTDNVGLSALSRPQNLRIMTGEGYVELKWDLSDSPELVGYNVYYGRTSGQYTRRRTVEKVNGLRIDQLNNGEAYYFAITAYDAQGKETDYSDEVAVVVGEPLSSTAPFEDFMDSLLANVPTSPENGPLVGWLAFSILGLGGTLYFRKSVQN